MLNQTKMNVKESFVTNGGAQWRWKRALAVGTTIAIRELLDLDVGHVIMLPQRAKDPVHLNIAGKPMFRAYPVRYKHKPGRARGKQIVLSAAGR